MSARARKLTAVPKPAAAPGEKPKDALGDASFDLQGVALLLENMVHGCHAAEPWDDGEKDRAFMIIADLVREIAKYGELRGAR
jgi:hypothetical protein